MHRRQFLVGGGLAVLGASVLRAQKDTAAPPQGTTSNLFDMNQGAAKTTRRPPKPGARASMSNDDRDALEKQIHCQCGCTLDVYVCRTTDFSCEVSPAMHRDVIALVEGGYSAQEILDAFVETYGERALMAPRRQGFNWAGYLTPFAAVGIGAIALVTVLRGMRRRSVGATLPLADGPGGSDASADELARLQAAIRNDS